MQSGKRLAIGAMLWAATASLALAGPEEGKSVFEARNCVECHYTEGPARETSIDDQLAKTGPELWYAGDKFRRDWLAAWLAEPLPIRPLQYNSLTEENAGDHVALGAGEAADVADFLMGLRSGEVEAGTVEPKTDAKGRLIFTKNMPCSGCHTYPGRRGVLTGGRSGPSLAEAGRRLNPDWILAYLQKPEVFKPVKMMPVFVGLLSDKDMEAVARYVSSFGTE